MEKKEKKVKGWWKKYCKKHNLDRKDARYTCLVLYIFICFVFLFNKLVGQLIKVEYEEISYARCLEDREQKSIAYCKCSKEIINNVLSSPSLIKFLGESKKSIKNKIRSQLSSCRYLLNKEIDDEMMKSVKKHFKKSFVYTCTDGFKSKDKNDKCHCVFDKIEFSMTEENWKTIYYCGDDNISLNCVNNISIINKYLENAIISCKAHNIPKYKSK